MRYVKSIGLNSNQQRGRGFNHPYDIAFSSDDRIYVLNRMYPQSSDGIRVQICDINDEWYGEFGHGRPAGGGRDDCLRYRYCSAVGGDHSFGERGAKHSDGF